MSKATQAQQKQSKMGGEDLQLKWILSAMMGLLNLSNFGFIKLLWSE